MSISHDEKVFSRSFLKDNLVALNYHYSSLKHAQSNGIFNTEDINERYGL